MTDNNDYEADTIYEKHSEMTGITISEMAEMISIYFDEIHSVAKNLEKTDSPLPKKDIIRLLNSLIEYAETGTELVATFNGKVEKFAVAKKSDLNGM